MNADAHIRMRMRRVRGFLLSSFLRSSFLRSSFLRSAFFALRFLWCFSSFLASCASSVVFVQ